MKVESRVTGGGARVKKNTPEFSLIADSRGFGMSYNGHEIAEYRRYASHRDGRTYIVELNANDLAVFLRDLAKNRSGRALLIRMLNQTEVEK